MNDEAIPSPAVDSARLEWPPGQNLIVVAGHAPFKESTVSVPEHPEDDDPWVLQPFQRGEPPLYIEHIRRGLALLAQDVGALLIFSGGYTRQEAGLRWSEADTYAAIARHFCWWAGDEAPEVQRQIESHIATEDASRDSFENLLFSICRFQQVTGHYPKGVTLVSWAFKRARFDLHRAAIRFPSARFRFIGFNDPLDREPAVKNEALTRQDFLDNRYGSSPKLARKRAARNPFHRKHGFHNCPGLGDFFHFINDPGNGRKDFPGRLPWADEPA